MSERVLCGLTEGLQAVVDWRPSPNFTRRRTRDVRLICIHTAECAESSTAAESLAAWVAGPARPKASWHFALDEDSVTQSVALDCESWHAGPINPWSVGIELAGRANQTVAQWGDLYSGYELAICSGLVAVLCEVYRIPVRRVSVDELRAGYRAGDPPRGLVGHVDVTRAISGSHTDPGPNFPWDAFLQRVAFFAQKAPAQ